MLYWILLVSFLLFLGAFASASFAERAMPGDRPPVYYSESFLIIIKLFLIPALVLFVILMIMDWTVTLLATIPGVLLLNWTFRPIAEIIIIIPLHKILIKS
jgi:hypothetical protein